MLDLWRGKSNINIKQLEETNSKLGMTSRIATKKSGKDLTVLVGKEREREHSGY